MGALQHTTRLDGLVFVLLLLLWLFVYPHPLTGSWLAEAVFMGYKADYWMYTI